MGGNLASMHMRNLECAIVVFAKLRGVFVETSGVFCGVGVWSGALRVWDSQKLPNLMSIKELGVSYCYFLRP